MPDESDYITTQATHVVLSAAVNAHTTVDAAIQDINGAKWMVTGVPTSDPHVVGQVWKNSGVLTVSAG